MITEITKRDGSLEVFSPEKLNGWSIWAAEHLGGFVDWSGIAQRAVSKLQNRCSSQDLQLALIRECLEQKSWAYYRMAARLYVPYLRKKMYNGEIPTIQALHAELVHWNLAREMDYSDAEYAQIEKMINHKRDFNYAHFQIEQIVKKYSLHDRRKDSDSPILGRYFETPQFVYMRMAMALAEDEPRAERMTHIKKWYDHFSCNRINAPTPNFTNLGTTHNGYASCCLYVTDDSEPSLAAGDHIARTMTVSSAGIGGALICRSLGDMVRGGLIVHQGKVPYYKALAGAVNSSIQNGRGGACTTYFSAYDPEVMTLMNLRHPKSPEDKRILTMDFAIQLNKHIVRKALDNEDIFTFNAQSAPDLVQAFFSGEPGQFEALYAKYEQDPNFKKNYVSARKIVVGEKNVAVETGSLYEAFMDEINRHTPFYDPIHSSNLCVEITEPTTPYETVFDLQHNRAVGKIQFKAWSLATEAHYNFEMEAPEAVICVDSRRPQKAAQDLIVGDRFRLNRTQAGRMRIYGSNIVEATQEEFVVKSISYLKPEPEVALCSLAALIPSYIENDEQYADAAYYALKMIDKCIHMSSFPLAHVGYTARQRLSAGIGLTGVAHYMARKRLKYTSIEGKQELHRLAERHAYHIIRASLRLGKELGNAPWMHRTKWPEGWLPIDTYNRNVDSIAPFEYQFDWEELRREIIANGGIRNSALIAHMPTESSSKASGVPNGLYAIRDSSLAKTDNESKIDWAPTDGDKLKRHYQIAWDIPYKDQIETYAIVQKFTDQAISADEWLRLEGDAQVFTADLLQRAALQAKHGQKTRYYFNSKTSKTVKNEETGLETIIETTNEHSLADSCTSGGCDV